MTDSVFDEEFDNLILSGAVQVSGIDSETGEMLYTFTEKLKELDPKLYHKMHDIFYQDILFLWERGFLSMDVTQDNPIVSITEKALNVLEVEKLPNEQKMYLQDIMNKMLEK